jgi:hypothetical protein
MSNAKPQQFSLRLLLAAMALFCGVFALAAYDLILCMMTHSSSTLRMCAWRRGAVPGCRESGGSLHSTPGALSRFENY